MTLSKHLLPALRTTLILAIFTGLLFPALVYVIAHLFFVDQAEGSLLRNKDGIIIGSNLIGQNFGSPKYFHSRPSAAGSGYDAAASGGTNLGPTSKKLIQGDKSFVGIEQLAKMYKLENNLPSNIKIPIDSVTRSASGLDPNISIENAKLQALRVANARHMTLSTVLDVIEINKSSRQFGFLGEPCVNVLALNLSLDNRNKTHE